MNTQLTPFQFEGQHTIRAMCDASGDPWFVATDVCRPLDVGNVSMALGRLDDDEKGITTIDTPGGKQDVLTVSESGLYSLILTSRKPQAKVFKRWITHEVLPAIRKTGQYAIQPKSLAELALIHAQALVDHEKRLVDHDTRLHQLESRVQGEPDMHSVMGYCKLRRIDVDLREAQMIGQRAKRLSVARGLPVGKVNDPRFGEVNTYKDTILEEIFQEMSK